jgi:hypothetical protein
MRRASVISWLVLLVAAMLGAAPCDAVARRKAAGSGPKAKRPSVTHAAQGKKPLSGARKHPVRWHPGLELARQMAGKRDVKR